MKALRLIDFKIWKIHFEFGWFPGDPFMLFGVATGEVIQGLKKVDTVILFDFQVAYLSFSVSLQAG